MSSINVTRRSAIKLGAGAMALAAGATMMASSNVKAARAGEAEGGTVFSAPGTYTGEGPGRNGTLTMTMTCSDDAIESIEVSSNETVTIGGYAADVLTDQVIEFQSLDFDNISGATFTCSAFRTALNSCVEQAGGDTSKLANEIVIEPIEYQTSADVVVVGAGGAGLSAGLTAAQAGASVIIIEKGSLVGGNTNATQSGINCIGANILEELGGTATYQDFIDTQTNELANPVLVEAFADVSGPGADWLASLGVDFSLVPGSAWAPLDQLTAEEPASMTGPTIVRVLKNAIDQQANIQVYLDTAATSLKTDDNGTVVGVVATGADGSEVTFDAGAVILATGGYGLNHELVVEYRPDYENVITDEIAPTTGDGIAMAEELTAGLIDMDQMMLHNRCCPGYGMLISGDLPGGRNAPSGIFVNKQSQRVGAETSLSEDQMLAQEDGIIYNIIPLTAANELIDNMLATHFAYQEDTVEALAEDLGLDPEALAATIDEWNEGAVDGIDNEFGRDDTGVIPLEGTLVGYSFLLAVHFCMGGIAFDGTTHALDTDENIIPGLYACGECTGGLHGTTRVDGSALSDAFVFGHVAGQEAADFALA